MRWFAPSLCLILMGSSLAGCFESIEDSSFNGIEYRDPISAPDFTLTDQHGELVTLSDFEGKVVVLAFIYTSCPDVCLIISSNLQWIKTNLDPAIEEEVVFLSITIDPARDTVDRFSKWTESVGYEWQHLTSSDVDYLVEVWSDWNVVVDNDHINASVPPEGSMNRVAVLNPDGGSFVVDTLWSDVEFVRSGADFVRYAFNSSDPEVAYHPENGTIGSWSENESWTWDLMMWDSVDWEWVKTNISLDNIGFGSSTHLAFAPSGSNISHLPPGIDCNGHGWVMGKGSGAHCMCDEGWKRPGGDWLSCVPEDSDVSAEEADPHEESLGEYDVGHTTTTFIIDRNGNKRIAWGGIMWDPGLFLDDIEKLANE